MDKSGFVLAFQGSVFLNFFRKYPASSGHLAINRRLGEPSSRGLLFAERCRRDAIKQGDTIFFREFVMIFDFVRDKDHFIRYIG